MQNQITAGDTLNYATDVVGYSASDGWVFKLRLVPRDAGASAFAIEGTPDGSSWLVRVPPSATSLWAPGQYGWAAWVERAGEVYTIQSGQVTVLPDPRTLAAGTDGRSLAVRTLADLIAARAQFATTQGRVASYKIGDRERTFRSAAELNQEIAYWEDQVAAEQQASRLAQGLAPRNRILVRFTRPR
jgi:hypothetical protein